MVKLTFLLFNNLAKKRLKSGFRDSLRLYIKGGSGGNGFPKFGGVGGKGGDVYVVGKDKTILNDVIKKFPSKRISGGIGEGSRNYRILGGPGEDAVIQVPLGVTVVTDEGIVLGEINTENDKVIVAHGGAGGCPSNQFNGQKGFSRSITLDLKLIADVGFVGFPNAGKSTLLKELSRASPKIANYPFTTIKPNVGIMEFDDFRQISLADLPGLIEGAHQNFGMGHRFLKHVVRTKLLLFVVDVHGFQLNPHQHFRNAFETIMLLNKELELYRENLMNKPAVLALTKMDLEGSDEKFKTCLHRIKTANELLHSLPEEMKPNRIIKFDKIIPVSSLNSYNIEKLKNLIRANIDLNFELMDSNNVNSRSFLSLNDSKQTTPLQIM